MIVTKTDLAAIVKETDSSGGDLSPFKRSPSKKIKVTLERKLEQSNNNSSRSMDQNQKAQAQNKSNFNQSKFMHLNKTTISEEDVSNDKSVSGLGLATTTSFQSPVYLSPKISGGRLQRTLPSERLQAVR